MRTAPSGPSPAEGLVHHHHVVWLIDVGVDGAGDVADAVIGGDGGAHALGAVFRKALDILARGKGGVGQQQAGGLGPLPAPAMPADLGHLLAHMFLPPSVPVCPAQTKKIPAPVKGRGSNHHRCTTRYCIPTYALPLTGNPGGAYFAAKRFGPQLRSDVPACPTDTGFPPAAGSLRSSERHYCLHHHLSCVKLLYIL